MYNSIVSNKTVTVVIVDRYQFSVTELVSCLLQLL